MESAVDRERDSKCARRSDPWPRAWHVTQRGETCSKTLRPPSSNDGDFASCCANCRKNACVGEFCNRMNKDDRRS